ncbi:F0F1 ATP synthase subunit delta [Corynebacterium propinquum]|jgi:ATP synthase F1, delta subunit|uniref:F0F1 ATP synthase subunit delta n=1 Tax=Corynebacterium propinquum TaxID=43769 RepID=UPI0003829958|nr:F0F1 ATP synthase subunit delta [Corynebacterium propinquum]MCT1817486.1 F0F1 ATP synthase subunit delta [Corynebacterium propinquum]MDK4233892.1 F0F1 ATP synthase subunit delta [Corynebacterium propinquum]MDK4238799.1 F0F1 ATP synthase subunit delta [Corynebacterium propinquum]MDK4251100.1 F0F1 ATP synthase subunit delta [Corynebacterium propinquum]MDK4292346.1 F0F1 ATP synthase subunit delta [Corynebacterium propinquum]
MKAASREALQQLFAVVDETSSQSTNAVEVDSQTGLEIFEVVEAIEGDRPLRVALANNAAPSEQRVALADEVFSKHLAASALTVVKRAVELSWSNPRDLRVGLVAAARRIILRGAENNNQLERVEQELFALSRVLHREGELSMLLSDRRVEVSKRRSLLARLLEGKNVTMFSEALALQAVGRIEKDPASDLVALAEQAAELRGYRIARVVSAGDLTSEQSAVLAEKLHSIYDHRMSIHNEVDANILGGVRIHVGNEVIDGSTKAKLERMRTALAAG